MVHLICKAALPKLGIILCSCLVYSSVSQILSNSTLRSCKRAMGNPLKDRKVQSRLYLLSGSVCIRKGTAEYL